MSAVRGPDAQTRESWRQKSNASRVIFHGLLKYDAAAEEEAAAAHEVAQRARMKVRRVLSVAEAMEAFNAGDGPAPPDNAVPSEGRPATREYERIARARGRRAGFARDCKGSVFRVSSFVEHVTPAPSQSPAPGPALEPEHPEQAQARYPNVLAEVSLGESSLAHKLASQDIRRQPLLAGNSFGALQIGPALDQALTSSTRTMMARSSATGGVAQDDAEALSEALLSLMGSGRVSPRTTGGWQKGCQAISYRLPGHSPSLPLDISSLTMGGMPIIDNAQIAQRLRQRSQVSRKSSGGGRWSLDSLDWGTSTLPPLVTPLTPQLQTPATPGMYAE
jgi:hypothetical protein